MRTESDTSLEKTISRIKAVSKERIPCVLLGVRSVVHYQDDGATWDHEAGLECKYYAFGKVETNGKDFDVLPGAECVPIDVFGNTDAVWFGTNDAKKVLRILFEDGFSAFELFDPYTPDSDLLTGVRYSHARKVSQRLRRRWVPRNDQEPDERGFPSVHRFAVTARGLRRLKLTGARQVASRGWVGLDGARTVELQRVYSRSLRSAARAGKLVKRSLSRIKKPKRLGANTGQPLRIRQAAPANRGGRRLLVAQRAFYTRKLALTKSNHSFTEKRHGVTVEASRPAKGDVGAKGSQRIKSKAVCNSLVWVDVAEDVFGRISRHRDRFGRLYKDDKPVPEFDAVQAYSTDPVSWIFEVVVFDLATAAIEAISRRALPLRLHESHDILGDGAEQGDQASISKESAAIGSDETRLRKSESEHTPTAVQIASGSQPPVPGAPESATPSSGTVGDSETKTRKRKNGKTLRNAGSSSDKSDTFELWRGHLLRHHNHGGVLNQTPVTPTEIQEAGIGCSKPSASRHFEHIFGGFRSYKRVCENDPGELEAKLMLLAGEVSLERFKPFFKDFQDKTVKKPGDFGDD